MLDNLHVIVHNRTIKERPNPMAYDKLSGPILYITADGNYGSDDILITGLQDFPEEYLEILGDLPDYERIKFAQAVLDGQDVSQWLD